MEGGPPQPLCLEGEISLSRFITAVSRFTLRQGCVREQHSEVSRAARQSYYAISGSGEPTRWIPFSLER